jgi:NAD(P)-dependent dehydrogenase (short-subunit alcohol dehydrogenase family)
MKERYGLENRSAIVTGGGRGIGKGIVLEMAEAGANVAVVDLDQISAREVTKEVTELGRKGVAIRTDVADETQVERMVEEVKEALGTIDILVNNAGIAVSVPAAEMTLEDWNKVIETNLTGAFLCSKHVGREMMKEGGGSIINISSIASTVVNERSPLISYCASKAGLNMLTRCLASEWAHRGIRVNAIAPGWIRTEQTDESDPEVGIWESRTPLGRLGHPTEIGSAVVLLASDASSYITGEIIVCDGGYTLG